MSARFRLGLIGGGRMGRTHLRALKNSHLVECVAVAEPFESSARELRSMGLAVFPTVEEMLAAGGIDGVIIAAPTDQHVELATKVIEAGVSVLCEKPFGISAEDARNAASLAAERGVALQIAYWRRFIPELVTLRQDIAAGKLGNIHLVVCSQWDEAPPPASFRNHSGGIYIDMGVHEINQMLWLLDQDVSDVSDVTAVAGPATEDPDAANDVDSAQALISLSAGASAVVSLGRFYPGGDVVTAEVFGSKGHVRLEVVSPESGEAPQLEALRLQAESFARHAAGGPSEGTTAPEAAEVLEIAQRLTDSASIAVLAH
ncbi:myo-inositol 2-dehydrogenase / D-chiro-inositol 1-dehydrogenase [Arthrobacter sp. 49Tsu3.1M3]|uniref:Gfo/Idh/MocA family protein n=1 Tax=Arthrobacter sp. 49Tsu3.1M3 TaxID=1279029 RepID=UPI0009A89BC6|nr:Gfo/Idh/MocA family oxidoreductase [Arthrobacter sp. 49Tsu3.1M3]SKB83967.1 myo-inositol 2-dehydrogenase / D-chiro-inositol 1-dehydrogenase [Arthrobacter sp. 49Tsu3.1M3]